MSPTAQHCLVVHYPAGFQNLDGFDELSKETSSSATVFTKHPNRLNLPNCVVQILVAAAFVHV